MPTRRAPLPDDVEPDQVWRSGEQHYRVLEVHSGVATLQRCTPAGRVLNQRYKESASVEQMRAGWRLVTAS